MTDSSKAIETIADTIEEAIEDGLAELGLSRADVDIEVLDEGGKGIFGIGNRLARVMLTPLTEFLDSNGELTPEKVSAAPVEVDDEIAEIITIAKANLAELVEKMNIDNATVSAELSTDTGRDGNPVIELNIEGDDLSILIGRKGETLEAIQYITRMIVGKSTGKGINLNVDIAGYNSRREQNLRRLARKMASQALSSGRAQLLEPMNPKERRIIHMELSNNKSVSTHSIGEEPKRKIKIDIV
jgi:spoIIIJ-associated protein